VFTVPALAYRLPSVLSVPLFGDRRRFGLVVQPDDPEWQEWLRLYMRFYQENQKQSVGKLVNDAGYRVLHEVNWAGKRVLEIGPGDLPHRSFWKMPPGEYALADVNPEMLERSAAKLTADGVPNKTVLMNRAQALPFADGAFDFVVSFYSLEHIYPLAPYLAEVHRVLAPGGRLVGAIPAEGGLAWGLGRFLTTRRWFKKHSSINPDKLICWEHPNFSDLILGQLNAHFSPLHVSYWPLRVPSADVNLVIKFQYLKKAAA
jgi:SAM-dependent methyltransferase